MVSELGSPRLHAAPARNCRPVLLYVALMVVAVCHSFANAADPLDEYQLGAGMYKQGRWALAVDSFQKFIETQPNHARVPLARLYKGLSLWRLEKYTEARQELRTYAKKYPRSRDLPEAMFRIAECSYFLGQWKPAEAEFKAFLAKTPKDDRAEWALPYLADVQLRLRKPKAAAANFEKSLKQHPNGRMVDDARFGLARAYEAQGKRGEADKLYNQLAANPAGSHAAQSQLNIATSYFDQKRFDLAAKAYGAIETRFPTNKLLPLARLNGGFAYYRHGDFRNAIAQFTLAAQHKPQLHTANYWAGVSHKELGEYDEAVKLLQATFKANSSGPLASSVLYQWAACEFRRGNYATARKLYLDVVTRWPKDRSADDALHFAGEAALQGGQTEEAKKLVDRFLRQFPKSGLRMHHAMLQGRVLVAQGGDENLRKAVSHFRTVLNRSRIPRTKMLARFHLARTLQKTGDYVAALRALNPLIVVVRQNVTTSEFADALVLQAKSLLETKEYEKSGEAISLYLKQRPNGRQIDRALAISALAAAHSGDRALAQSQLTSLRQRYPKSSLVPQTTHELAELAYDASQWDWSAALFQSLIGTNGDSPFHDSGLSGYAWSLYQQKKYREAAGTFARVVNEHSDNRELAPEAAFMQGKALLDAGTPVEAAKAFGAAFERFAPAKKLGE